MRTHFSDDYLWLPYVTCRYVNSVADTGVLDEKIGFLEGRPVVRIYTNPAPITRREVTRLADREYRMWLARNLGAGYGQYFEWQPKEK